MTISGDRQKKFENVQITAVKKTKKNAQLSIALCLLFFSILFIFLQLEH